MQSYARLARLPAPTRAPNNLAALVRRVVALETRLAVAVADSATDVEVSCDAAQIEQVVINLVKNAVDATFEAHPPPEPHAGVRVSWQRFPRYVELRIEDDGPGIANPGNLFVPFFTTKPEGSGIGLVLCRQIAENHGGSLTLENHPDATGSIARLTLPL
jgi:signal transduction histidine kinase